MSTVTSTVTSTALTVEELSDLVKFISASIGYFDLDFLNTFTAEELAQSALATITKVWARMTKGMQYMAKNPLLECEANRAQFCAEFDALSKDAFIEIHTLCAGIGELMENIKKMARERLKQEIEKLHEERLRIFDDIAEVPMTNIHSAGFMVLSNKMHHTAARIKLYTNLRDDLSKCM
jgi:uncharacterized protein (UPF0335 family)